MKKSKRCEQLPHRQEHSVIFPNHTGQLLRGPSLQNQCSAMQHLLAGASCRMLHAPGKHPCKERCLNAYRLLWVSVQLEAWL